MLSGLVNHTADIPEFKSFEVSQIALVHIVYRG